MARFIGIIFETLAGMCFKKYILAVFQCCCICKGGETLSVCDKIVLICQQIYNHCIMSYIIVLVRGWRR